MGTGAGLNLEELCGTGKNSENFSIVKACAGRERDQIMALRGGSEVKILSRTGLYSPLDEGEILRFVSNTRSFL